MKILVIEDEKAIADSVKDLLKKEGYTCELVSSFPEAGEKIHLYEYDCAIVDLNLPGGKRARSCSAIEGRASGNRYHHRFCQEQP